MTLLLLLGSPAAHAQAWWDPTWSERARLSFDNAASTTDLTDLTVLVVLRQGLNFDHAVASPAGNDLRFVDPDGTLLAYEIERWDDAGTSWLWVRVPRIDAGSTDDHVWLYYGKPAAPPGQQGTATWEPSFTAVLHLDTMQDSTAGDHDGVNDGTIDVPGIIGHGRDSDGDQDRIELTDEAAFDFTAAVTVSLWAHVDAWVHADWDALVTKGDESWRVHRCGGSSTIAFSVNHTDTPFRTICTPAPFDDGVPHYVVATYDGTAQGVWIDGALAVEEAETGTISRNNDQVWLAGNDDFSQRSLDGQLDEVRIASVGRSADWIAADFRSVSDALVTWCTRYDPDADADGMPDCFEPPVPPDTGTPPATGDTGAATPTPPDTATPDPSTRGASASTTSAAGCDCRTADLSPGPGPGLLVAALGALARRRRHGASSRGTAGSSR